MANINNLNTPNIPKLEQRVRAVESGAPMNNAAVGRSGFEVYDNGTINVSSGNIIGAGTFSWQGSFSQSGTSILSGSTTIAGPTGITGQLTIQGATSVTGPFTVTGDTKLNGKTDVGGNTTVTGTLKVTGAMSTTGTLSVEGVTTLKNDLRVVSGGKVTVGGMTLDPTAAGGSVVFSGGGGVQGSAGVIAVKGNGNAGFISDTTAAIFAGACQLTVSTTGYKFSGTPTTASAANVYMDANGNLFRKP